MKSVLKFYFILPNILNMVPFDSINRKQLFVRYCNPPPPNRAYLNSDQTPLRAPSPRVVVTTLSLLPAPPSDRPAEIWPHAHCHLVDGCSSPGKPSPQGNYLHPTQWSSGFALQTALGGRGVISELVPRADMQPWNKFKSACGEPKPGFIFVS